MTESNEQHDTAPVARTFLSLLEELLRIDDRRVPDLPDVAPLGAALDQRFGATIELIGGALLAAYDRGLQDGAAVLAAEMLEGKAPGREWLLNGLGVQA